jgi:hypothetical protein
MRLAWLDPRHKGEDDAREMSAAPTITGFYAKTVTTISLFPVLVTGIQSQPKSLG